jgi:2-keto-3-deoxygluconate permease
MTVTIPFFAFALGAGMDLATFFDPEVVGAGITLGIMTTVLTGAAGVAALWLVRERSQLAGVAEASTAGNAAATPAAIAGASAVAASAAQTALDKAIAGGKATADQILALTEKAQAALHQAEVYEGLVNVANAQIAISTVTTALLCPFVVILFVRLLKGRGIDPTLEDGPYPHPPD